MGTRTLRGGPNFSMAAAAAAAVTAIRQQKRRQNGNLIDLQAFRDAKKKIALQAESCGMIGNPPCKLPLQDLVQKYYQRPLIVGFVALLIVTNFFINILEKQIDPRSVKYTQEWQVIDDAFNIAFAVELIVNIYSCGGPFRPFWSSPWNCFDFSIVAIGLSMMAGLGQAVPELSRLKLLRAFRIFRLFKRIESLNKIVVSLLKALPGVVHAFLIMLIFFAIYAILAVELFVDFGDEGTYATYDEFGLVANVSSVTGRGFSIGEEYYGTFMRALYTLFQVMTGDSWSEAVARPLIFGLYPSSAVVVGIYFTSFILLTQIILVNVVVAVLLDKFVAEDDKEGDKDANGELGDMSGFVDTLENSEGENRQPVSNRNTTTKVAAAKAATTPKVSSEGATSDSSEVAELRREMRALASHMTTMNSQMTTMSQRHEKGQSEMAQQMSAMAAMLARVADGVTSPPSMTPMMAAVQAAEKEVADATVGGSTNGDEAPPTSATRVCSQGDSRRVAEAKSVAGYERSASHPQSARRRAAGRSYEAAPRVQLLA